MGAGFVLSTPFLQDLSVLVSFGFLGFGIKYIDEAFDGLTFSKSKSYLLVPILVLLGGIIMSVYKEAATILGAYLLAVLVKGKIDNAAFKLGFFGVIVLLAFMKLYEFLWFPFIMLFISNLLDEVGNDLVENAAKPKKRLLTILFQYRLITLVTMFYLTFTYVISWFFLVAYLMWWVSYTFVMVYSDYLKPGKTVITG